MSSVALELAAAATASDGFDPWSLLTTGGPVGILAAVFYLLVTGKLHTKGQIDRLETALTQALADAAQARSEHTALVTKLVDDVVPALTRSADATAASTAAVQEMTRRALSGGG